MSERKVSQVDGTSAALEAGALAANATLAGVIDDMAINTLSAHAQTGADIAPGLNFSPGVEGGAVAGLAVVATEFVALQAVDYVIKYRPFFSAMIRSWFSRG